MSIPSNKVMTLGDGKVLYDDLRGRIEDNRKNKAPVIISNASGSIASFTDGADDLPVEELVVNIAPVQAGTGDPSPSNDRAISGWTKANIGRAAKNLLGGIALANAVVSSMPSATINESEHRVSFAANASADHVISGLQNNTWSRYQYVFKENTQYTFFMTFMKNSGATGSSNLKIVYTDDTSDIIPMSDTPDTKTTVVFTSDSGKTIRAFYKSNSSGITHLYYEESGIFEGVLSAEEFEEWKGTVYGINFPVEVGTVYGGKLIINRDGTGKLIADCILKTYDGTETDITWGFTEALGVTMKYAFSDTDNIDQTKLGICNQFKWQTRKTLANLSEGEISYSTSGGNRQFNINTGTRFASLEDFKLHLATNNLQCCVKINPAVEYDLSVAQVKTLLGLNNIYADTGDVTVQYRADTKLFVDKYKGAQDVRINDTSILDAQGVAEIPFADANNFGVCGVSNSYGTQIINNGYMGIYSASDGDIKNGSNTNGATYRPITPKIQHKSVFYGLAKLAGADMAQSSNPVGQFTDEAKIAIQQMLGLWTPKFSISATCEEETANFGQTELVCDDVALNIGEELVVIIYQTNSENGEAIGGNNWADFVVRDSVNNAYLANAGYIMGSKPVMVSFKRFPYCIVTQTSWVNSIGTSSPLKVYPRSLDYVDKIRWLRLHFEGSVVKIGTRIDAYVRKF